MGHGNSRHKHKLKNGKELQDAASRLSFDSSSPALKAFVRAQNRCSITISNHVGADLLLDDYEATKGSKWMIPPTNVSNSETATFMVYLDEKLDSENDVFQGSITFVLSDDSESDGKKSTVELSFLLSTENEPEFDWSASEGCPVQLDLAPASSNLSTQANVSCIASSGLSDPTNTEGSLAPSIIDDISATTYFDPVEVETLWDAFKKLANARWALTPETFVETFPELNSKRVVKSLFHSIDKLGRANSSISFGEFVKAVSVMTRGSPAEKAALVHGICDLDGGGTVSRKEVLITSMEISEVMNGSGFTSREYGDAEETVNNLFLKRIKTTSSGGKIDMTNHSGGHRHRHHGIGIHARRRGDSNNDDVGRDDSAAGAEAEAAENANDEDEPEFPDLYDNELGLKEFVRRGQHESDLITCFGLFDFFRDRIVKNVQGNDEELDHGELCGWLEKDKGQTLLGGAVKPTRRFFMLRGGFIGYAKSELDHFKGVFPLTTATVRADPKSDTTFILRCPGFSRHFYASSKEEATTWVSYIRANIRESTRFRSFAPIRRNISAKWFVGAKDYFSDLFFCLENAKSRLMIGDWFFSPGVYLKRGEPLDESTRLDRTLLRAAQRGVLIYIIIWNEPIVGFEMQSQFVVDYMNDLHPNFRAIGHPNTVAPMWWTHHQKFVVVDEVIAFVGGIDLAYGRYDDDEYSILDPMDLKFPGRDYCNFYHMAESNGPTKVATIDRRRVARLPWQDVHMQVKGAPAKDVAVNFIQRWNHAIQSLASVPKSMHFIFPVKTGTPSSSPATSRPTARNDTTAPSASEPTFTASELSSPREKMPTQDPKSPDSASLSSPQVFAAFNDAEDSPEPEVKAPATSLTGIIGTAIQQETKARPNQPLQMSIDLEETEAEYQHCDCQVLRSISEWSVGIPTPETSIYKAYITLIRESEHFIYIENQYFISSIDLPAPKNRIAEAIYKRIKRAIVTQQPFRVIVVLPVYPSGEINNPTTKYLIKYTYKSINRGLHSIMQRLKRDHPEINIDDYISFYCMRRYAELNDQLITESVYIHSKVLIIDDRVAIIGSANINDRSLRGTRDSELCIVTEQPTVTRESQLNGSPVRVSPFVQDLRVRLMAAKIGLKDSPVVLKALQDLVSAEVYCDTWMKTADSNTAAFMEVFKQLPNNSYKLSQLPFVLGESSGVPRTDEALEILKGVQGSLIRFPLDFLKDEDLSLGALDKEMILPKAVFL